MTLARRLLTSVAALGLVITTATAGTPALTANANQLPNVKVTRVAYTYSTGGVVDVTFGISNKDADATMTLATTCDYDYKANGKKSRQEDGKLKLQLSSTQSVPLQKFVTCNPSSTEFVATVAMVAIVDGGDSDTTNNGATWDYSNVDVQPDVDVATLNYAPLRDGGGKNLFGINNIGKGDAPVVNLKPSCSYQKDTTHAFFEIASVDTLGATVAVPHGGDYNATWVTCAGVPGSHLIAIFLTAEVDLPLIDPNISNNTAYRDLLNS